MSDRGVASPVETFGLLMWREALGDGPIAPDAQDLMAWAFVLEEAAATREAQLLRDCAAVLQGFSPEAKASRTPASDPDRSAFGDAGPGDTHWTTVAAAREVADLARAFQGSHVPTLTRPASPAYSGYPDNPAGIGPSSPIRDLGADMAVIARSLLSGLGDDASHEEGALRTSLDLLVELDRRSPHFDYRTYRTAPVELVSRAIAQAVMVGFALATRDLWTTPLGSPAFFWASARLSNAALGPYFGNVTRIVRHARDIYDLAQYASAAAQRTGDEDACGAWIALLSRGCQGVLLDEIIHDLSDYSARRTLGAVLDRIASSRLAKLDRDSIRHIRDGGIDAADYPLAARAQKVLASSEPHSDHEWLILGDIHATGGDFVAAEGVYRRLLGTGRDDAVIARLAMIRRDEFTDHHVKLGFHSPADRLASRLQRRGIHGAYPRRTGQVIAAVDVS